MRFRTLALLIVFLVGTTTAGESKDSKTKAKPKPKAEEEEVLTFTTEDMERKYGKSPKPTPATQPSAEPEAKPDPLAQLQASQQAERDKLVQRAEAQRQVQAAQEKVAELQKRLASLRNPLLARPQLTEEEKEAWNGADQVGRVRMTEENLAAAHDELAAARTALNKLR